MAGQSLSLTWHDHHSSLVALVETLLGNNWLVDCTLAAEGKYLKAHKVILSACSPYFQILFNQESEKNPIVILKDVKFEYLKFIIDFIYRGEVQLRHTQLNDFLELAKSLQVKGLDTFHEEQNAESSRNNEPLYIEPVARNRQTEKTSIVSEREGRGYEIVDNVNISGESYNLVPISQEHNELVGETDKEATVTIESAYSIAPGTSFGSDANQWSLPLELPNPPPPRSPSALTDHSADTVIMVHPGSDDEETVELLTEVKREDRENSLSEKPLKNEPETRDEDIPQSNNSVSRSSSPVNKNTHLSTNGLSRSSSIDKDTHLSNSNSPRSSSPMNSGRQRSNNRLSRTLSPIQITEALMKDDRFNPKVRLNKLNVNPLIRTNKTSKSQVQDNCSRVAEGSSKESTSAGGETSIATQSTPSSEQGSKRASSPNRELLISDSSDSSTISSESPNPQPTGSSAGKIRKRKALMKAPSANPAKRYKCHECTESFFTNNELVSHMKQHPNTEWKPYECEKCSRSFDRSSSLARHKLSHTGSKPYQCSYCHKRFSQAGNLATHTRSHTGDRPFQCQQCLKTFTQAINLTNHVRIHTGEHPYKCKICNKGYTRASTLTIHMRIHSGERPYECEHCGKKFICNSHLWAHRRHYMKYV